MNQSINQWNFYHANFPAKPGSVAQQLNRCSTAKSVKQFHNINGHSGVVQSRGGGEEVKSKRRVSRCFFKVATDMAQRIDSERFFQRDGAQEWKLLPCVGLDPRHRQTNSFLWSQCTGWMWCGKHGVKINRLLFIKGFCRLTNWSFRCQNLSDKICSDTWSRFLQKLQLPLTNICDLQFMQSISRSLLTYEALHEEQPVNSLSPLLACHISSVMEEMWLISSKGITLSAPRINQSINQSINQTSRAPISPAKPDSVARQPNHCSTAKSRKQFRSINRPWRVTVSMGVRPNQRDVSSDIS